MRFSNYLRTRSPAGANAVVQTIEHRIDGLVVSPYAAPVTDEPTVRELTIVRYPYKVYYQVLRDKIMILHIRHTSRAPWEGVR